MEQNREYYAFISYQREDERWAKWLQHKLEHYRLPSNLNGRTDLPREIRPVFRDTSELNPGNLPQQIHDALAASKHLIVVCSPRSASSLWVNLEVEEFIKMGKGDCIIPFIVDGRPFANDPSEECFPPAIRDLPKEQELLGANVNEMGRDAAAVKTVAQMFGVRFDTLWKRYEREQKRKRALVIAAVALFVLAVLGVVQLFSSISQERKIAQARVIAEQAIQLASDGDSYTACLVALQALPPYYPYVVEAEDALRKVYQQNCAAMKVPGCILFHAAFSLDGKLIVTASNDNLIRIWDAYTGVQIGQPLKGHTDVVNYAVFSPDGKHIVSASRDSTIRIWDVSTGKQMGIPLIGHTDDVNSAVFSPDGKRIVSASADRTVRIWDAATGKQIRQTLVGHKDKVNYAVFSPDGKRIASASDDGTIRIWNSITGKQIRRPLKGHRRGVFSIAFSHDGKQIFSASGDSTVRIWNVVKGKQIGSPLVEHTSIITSVDLSSDGKRIALVTGEGSIMVCDAASGSQYGQPHRVHKRWVSSAVFSPDGNRIVSASADGTIRLWDVDRANSFEKRLKGHTNMVYAVAFSNDGMRVVSEAYGNDFIVWDIATGIQVEPQQDDYVLLAKISPDSMSVLLLNEKNVTILNTETFEKKSLNGHTNIITSASFSPDGTRIVTASWDNTIRIWDAATGKIIGRPLEGHNDIVSSANFSPDGTHIVSASWDATIRIWDALTGRQIGQPLVEHAGEVRYAAFSSDGKRIVSASEDKTIRVWDAVTGKQIGPSLVGHDDVVNMVVFSPDGEHIASASNDSTVILWKFPTLQVLINEIQERFRNRSLTPEERRQYCIE